MTVHDSPSGVTGHTPGPWDWLAVGANASGGFHLYIIDGAKRKIAALWGKAAEKEANASLIAAAPDLLAAAQSAHDLFMAYHGEFNSADFDPTWRKLHAALAKATGKPG